jgi:aminoglycoside phosphotransferase (APT) family kinase protein
MFDIVALVATPVRPSDAPVSELPPRAAPAQARADAPASGSGEVADPQLAETAVRWIEQATGSRVVGARRFPRARDTWWIETQQDGARRRWLLKGRRAPARVMARSRLLSDFGAAREAAAMGALASSGVRVPGLGGFDEESALLLIERVPGSALIHRAPGAERRAAVADYARQLALLHTLELPALQLGTAIAVPDSPRDMALGGWLRSAEADADTAAARLRHAEPLLTLLVRWLHENVPAGRGLSDMRLLHGDAGVTNFLSVNGRVTALVDWELAIIGDPMSDLGNARYREALYPSGTYAELIAAYEQATGAPVDERAVGYYTVLASTVLSLGMVANVHHPRVRQPESVARLWQDAIARCVACEAACEVSGIDLDYDDLAPAESSFDPLAELLVERLDELTGDDPAAHGYGRLARAVHNAVRLGAAADEALVAEVAALVSSVPTDTGLPTDTDAPTDAAEALAALQAAIPDADADAEQRLRMLVVLARDARRRLQILAPLRDAEIWEDQVPGEQATPAALPARVLPALRETAAAR